MFRKLKEKGFHEKLIEDTVEYLVRSGLINDETLALDLFNHATERKSLGKNGVRMFLMKRGIDKKLVENVLLDHSDDMEERSAREFIERKLRTLKQYPEQAVKRRLGGMLQRRGFSTDVIYKIIHSIRLQ